LKNLISIAKIVKTRGIRGEVAADLLTDFPDRFAELRSVVVAGPGHQSDEELEDFWFHGNRIILKFVGRDRPHEVEELVGCDVRIPEEDRVIPPEGTYFDSDLEGCSVFESGVELGVVAGIQRIGGTAGNLVVADPSGREVLIPMVKEFIKSVSVESRRIEVALPPGLLELGGEGGSLRKKGDGS